MRKIPTYLLLVIIQTVIAVVLHKGVKPHMEQKTYEDTFHTKPGEDFSPDHVQEMWHPFLILFLIFLGIGLIIGLMALVGTWVQTP